MTAVLDSRMKKCWKKASLTVCVCISSLVAPLTLTAQGTVNQSTIQSADACELQIFFPISVTTLTPTQISVINRFVSESRTDDFAVRGYASNIGDTQNNVLLSQSRSQSVASIVQQAGEVVSASAFGEAGDGPLFQRADLLRENCAAELIDEVAGPSGSSGGSVAPFVGLGVLLLLIGGASSSDGT